MKRVFTWMGIGAACLTLVVAALLVVASIRWSAETRKVWDVPEVSLAGLRPDVARGEYIVRFSAGCVMCHGDDLGGATIMDDPAAGRLDGPNITSAALKDWTPGQVARAIHHGVGRDGHGLLLMPVGTYQHYSREDLAAIVAFLKASPPVTRPNGPKRIGGLIKALWLVGVETEIIPAANVDHAAPFTAAVPEGPTRAYGKYLYTAHCAGCHFDHGRGGRMKSGPPDWPPAANLTVTGAAGWTREEFVKAMRTGVNPAGTKIRTPMLEAIQRFVHRTKEDDLRAIWEHLRTLEGGAEL